MSRIETTVNIGFAVLVEDEDRSFLDESMASEFTDTEFAEKSVEPEDYDPEYPLDGIEEMEELYYEYLKREYPLLGVEAFGARYAQIDGYVVFIESTRYFLDETGDFDMPEPTKEELAQLKKFQHEFVPKQEIGLKQWMYFS